MKIAILLSGGVDSSVALRLLKNTGDYEITAFYLKIWLEDELKSLGNCPWEDDLRYVRTICLAAEVPLEIVSLQGEYFEKVIEHAIHELRSGATPSPDILCNQRIKFGEFYKQIGPEYEKVATGHYAQVKQLDTKYSLLRSPDAIKDQTYFLYSLNQRQLARALFPIGHLHKHEVRKLAEDFNLPNKARKDSQGLCFLGKIQYNEFIKFHLGEKKGPIINASTGRQMGEHLGYWFYTIGQRKGLGLSGGPWYVIKKDIDTNTVYVSHWNELPNQTRDHFTVRSVHWICGKPDKNRLLTKIRHGPSLIECEIEPSAGDRLKVKMAMEDPGIATGQSAIFYDDRVCLGGGLIE